jgi:hypothetical protein
MNTKTFKREILLGREKVVVYRERVGIVSLNVNLKKG